MVSTSYKSLALLLLSTGSYVLSESTSSIVSIFSLAPFWQSLQLQSSEHFKLAFLQEQRLLVQPVLHLQLYTKSSTESGAGGKVIHVTCTCPRLSISHPCPEKVGAFIMAFMARLQITHWKFARFTCCSKESSFGGNNSSSNFLPLNSNGQD